MTNVDDAQEQRKAVEILLDIENKITHISGVINNYDMNMKLILDRVNKMYKFIDQIEKEHAQELASTRAQTQNKPVLLPLGSDKPEVVWLKQEDIVPLETNPVGQRKTSRTENVAEMNKVPSTTSTQPLSSSDKKIPVVQRITDSKGKDLFLAEVIIKNENNEQVLKTKTNAAGKWQGYLKPGKYTVSVLKVDTITKEEKKINQEINISNSLTTVVLPVAIIKRD